MVNQSIVSIDSSNSSILSDVMIRPPECGPFDLDLSGILDVKIFIDCSVVEVFIGKKTMFRKAQQYKVMQNRSLKTGTA